jgi:hypothetical protein
MLRIIVSVGSVCGSDLLPGFDEIFVALDIDGSSDCQAQCEEGKYAEDGK